MEELSDEEFGGAKMKENGRVISVYDGRKWPVVQCGSVVVSPEEKVSVVKACIVSGNISKERRKKSSKYALAVASSFGHVHAFLQDEDYVLNKLDSTTAEEKCLMLIKKPKSSSKKMFKSQSWANLSLSDSHLYNQQNYNTEGRKHKYRMKRKPSDLQTVPSESMMNLSDYGMRVDSYIPQQRDIRNRDMRNVQNRMSGVASPQSCHSENLNYRNGNQTEINNNKLSKNNGSRMYSSHTDIYRMPPKLSYIKENCVIRSDEMYTDKPEKTSSLTSKDPDTVSRAHSVGDLSTGLTLSVVGQRKADSVQCLPTTNNAFKPVTEDVKKSDVKSYTDTRRVNSARKCVENKKDLQNTLRDLLSNIAETKERDTARTQNSDSEKRDNNTPIKPKRALPSVPQGQANDRKKHYTEMVKIRMSQHSRNGPSSSSVRTVQDTPVDREVSDLLGNDRESCPGMLENTPYKEDSSHLKQELTHQDTLNVSIPSSIRSCDSGQATITSLSSTVDSGYLTNDPDNDMYSSTSYTKCLQRSAQNFYSKKAPVVHSQSLHRENAITETLILKENVDTRTHTFPRSSNKLDVELDNNNESIQQKSKHNICDKPVKYSSTNQLSKLEPLEGQRLQTISQDVPNKCDNEKLSESTNKIVCTPKKEDIAINRQSSQLPGGSQIPLVEPHYNTLPGNWKFQHNENYDDNSVKHTPSLHQLALSYRFIPVTIQIGLEYNVLDHFHLCERFVKLQNTKKTQKRESTAMSPPQGKYARLGGPGSAFKPVKVTDSYQYMMVCVEGVSNVFCNKHIQKGDIIIEVNNKIVIGEPVKSVQTMISSCTGELLMTIARSAELVTSTTQTANQISGKPGPFANDNTEPTSHQPTTVTDSQVEHLKKQIAKLNIELKRKNKAIRELNTLLPWRPSDDQSEINGNNEITLNGLSEDEFIV